MLIRQDARYDRFDIPVRRPPRRLGSLLIAALVGGLFGRYVLAGWMAWAPGGKSAAPRAVTPRGDLSSLEKSTINLFESVSPSVAYISTAATQPFGYYDSERRGTGSGFVWDTLGHVVTNYHVIHGANQARVTLHDNTSYDAVLVGTAPDKDIAVLKIKAPPARLRPISIGTSKDLRVGQSVFAIGNPYGLDYTLTTGLVSALNRQIKSMVGRTIQNVIQTDAAINPGNSGGPLMDSAGRLIGMNTAILSQSGSSAGIGFAVPVDIINRIVPQLIAYGKVIRPGLGINLASDDVAARMGITGVIIVNVIPGGSAEKAGLRGVQEDERGRFKIDVILKVGDRPTPNYDALATELEKYNIGDTVELTVLRQNKQIKVSVQLQEVE